MYKLYDYSKLNFILIVEMSPITKLLISSVHTEVSVTVLKSYLQLDVHIRHAARWEAGGAAAPQILADQLTISRQGRTHYPHPVLPAPPDF